MIYHAWLLACKDLRVYVRDRAALCLGFAVPIALVTVFGWIMTFAFGGSSGMPAVELWVVDEDQTDASRAIVQSLRNSESLKVRPRVETEPLTREQARQKIADGEAHHALIIPKGYSANSSGEPVDLQMLRDPGRTIEDRLIQFSLLQSTMMQGDGSNWNQSMQRMFRKRGMDSQGIERLNQAMSHVQNTIRDFVDKDEKKGAEEPRPVDSKPSVPANNDGDAANKSFDAMEWMTEMVAVDTEDIQPPQRSKNVTYQRAQSVAGMSVMMSLFGLTGAGSVLLAEREKGTLKRLFGMPLPRESVLLGKFFFVGIVGLAQMIVLFVYGELMFRVGMFRDPLTLVAIVLTWVTAATCFGMWITTFSKSAKQADSLSTILILTMAALGGCWFPLQMMNLPLPMEILCKSMMTYWAMEALQGMLWNNLTLFDPRLLLAIGIQWIWIVVLVAASVYFFRRNYCRD